MSKARKLMISRVGKRSKAGNEMPVDQRLSCIIAGPISTIIDGIRVQRPQSHCYAGKYWSGWPHMENV